MSNEMSHCLCFVVTSWALSSVGDIHVVQMFVKSYVSSDKLLISFSLSVLMVCLFPRMVFVVHYVWSKSLT